MKILRKLRQLNQMINLFPYFIRDFESLINDGKLLTAKSVINTFNYSVATSINEFEFKVYSQWGDDGIIQYLIRKLELPNKTFIEFGVENYSEANTRFLLLNNNWHGLIIDGSKSNIEQVKHSDIYWKYDLNALYSFITCENINDLILQSGFKKEVGILSVDIDGNDYWIWKRIDCITPIIVIAEYNSVFGAEHAWTIPYKADFVRSKEHFSNLYYGVSILSLVDLAEEKGYYFVGCNGAGNNAYFIRKDKIGTLKPVSVSEGYISSKFKESRDKNGKFNFLRNEERIKLIKGLPIFNTRTLQVENIV